MTIILAIIAQAEILAMDGKHNFVALYANIMVVAIVKIAIRWIFKPTFTGKEEHDAKTDNPGQ